MGRAALVKRRRKEKTRKPWLPEDHWIVTGTGQHGDKLCFEESSKVNADEAAAKINHNGGNVRVVREVYDSPAATWKPVKGGP